MGAALVTGGRGFVGAWLAKALLGARAPGRLARPQATARARPFDAGPARDRGRGDRRRGRPARRRARHRRCSPNTGSTTSSTSPRRRSSAPSPRRPRAASRPTCAGPGRCSRPAAGTGSSRVVVASSDKAYGAHDELPYREDFALQPTAPYEASKAAADLIARSYWHSYGLPVAVTRFANIYGGGDLNFSRLIPEAVCAARRRPGAGAALRRLARARLPLRRGRRARLPGDRRRARPRRGPRARRSTPAAARPHRGRRRRGDDRRARRHRGRARHPGHRQPGRARSTASTSTRRRSSACAAGSPQVALEEGLERTIEWYRDHPEARPGRRAARAERSAPGRIRTCGLPLRRRALYPLSYGRGRRSRRSYRSPGGDSTAARHHADLIPRTSRASGAGMQRRTGSRRRGRRSSARCVRSEDYDVLIPFGERPAVRPRGRHCTRTRCAIQCKTAWPTRRLSAASTADDDRPRPRADGHT